ncbi:MAG: endonuclease III [Bacteroidales bacterium]|jgi:endonuclease-3|nr:endonuclease III [Bacteroidales bacterium]
MTRKQLFTQVTAWFQDNMPVAQTELHYRNPFELLVAVILSAQCTDKRVNMITPPLFERYPAPELLAEATPDEVFAMIKSCSYPNNKSKHLVGMARVLVDKFNGQVPEKMDELIQLPGVGRKTANVIVSVVFNQPALAVDTHVFRVSQRIGLTANAKTPADTEKQLCKYFPRHLWGTAHHWLILHGRYVCTARKPKCQNCGLSDFCLFKRFKV